MEIWPAGVITETTFSEVSSGEGMKQQRSVRRFKLRTHWRICKARSTLATMSKPTGNFVACKVAVASTMLPFWATMSKQHSTLSKWRNFNAKLVRHCCRFLATKSNVASTLLLVWTWLKFSSMQDLECDWRSPSCRRSHAPPATNGSKGAQ